MSNGFPPGVIGQHILYELVPKLSLDEKNRQLILKISDDIYSIAAFLSVNCGAHVLDVKVHNFPGGGYTAFILLAESHLAIHTWPEKEYASMDIFGCRKEFIDKTLELFPNCLEGLSFCIKSSRVIERGL